VWITGKGTRTGGICVGVLGVFFSPVARFSRRKTQATGVLMESVTALVNVWQSNEV